MATDQRQVRVLLVDAEHVLLPIATSDENSAVVKQVNALAAFAQVRQACCITKGLAQGPWAETSSGGLTHVTAAVAVPR